MFLRLVTEGPPLQSRCYDEMETSVDETRFAELYRSAARFRHASPLLRTLLRNVYAAATHRPARLAELKRSLQALLEFLVGEEGRTDANCCVTDAFFSAEETWEQRWTDLPPSFVSVLNDLGGVLHDAVYAAHIARNFESLPEQLLDRVRALP